jgi:hypothetical protein
MEPLRKKASEHRILLLALFKAEASYVPTEQVHVDAVDTAAKLATYPYVMDVLESQHNEIIRHFNNTIDTDVKNLIRNKDKTQELAKEYGKRVRDHAMEVLAFRDARPIARVNVARTLAAMYVLGQPELADNLVDIFRDPKQNDGVHYWAARGLQDLLAMRTEDGPAVDKARTVKAAQALAEFLQQKSPLDVKLASREEIDGYRLLRRQVIRALGQTRLAVVNDKVMPALILAKFAGNDKQLRPVPRLDERLEASIGLARIRPSKEVANFQPDYAMWQIGLFLEAWGKTANDNREAKAGNQQLRPYKIDAARLVEVLQPLKTEVKNDYVAKAVDVANRIVAAVSKGNVAQAGDLTWFASNRPPSKELFKGVAGSTVDPDPPEPYLPRPEKKDEEAGKSAEK